MPPEALTEFAQALPTSPPARMSAPNGPEHEQISPTVMGAPVVAAADVGLVVCPPAVAPVAVPPVVGWVVPELDLLLDEQAATPMATARIPTPHRALLLILT